MGQGKSFSLTPGNFAAAPMGLLASAPPQDTSKHLPPPTSLPSPCLLRPPCWLRLASTTHWPLGPMLAWVVCHNSLWWPLLLSGCCGCAFWHVHNILGWSKWSVSVQVAGAHCVAQEPVSIIPPHFSSSPLIDDICAVVNRQPHRHLWTLTLAGAFSFSHIWFLLQYEISFHC